MLDEIKQAEQEAARMVADAHDEARTILERAKNQVVQGDAKARDEALVERSTLVERATNEAEQKAAAITTHAAEEAAREGKTYAQKVASAARSLVQSLMK